MCQKWNSVQSRSVVRQAFRISFYLIRKKDFDLGMIPQYTSSSWVVVFLCMFSKLLMQFGLTSSSDFDISQALFSSFFKSVMLIITRGSC
jgi:hypothetical protein